MKTLILCAIGAFICKLVASSLEATRYKDSGATVRKHMTPEESAEWHRGVDSSKTNLGAQFAVSMLGWLFVGAFALRLLATLGGAPLVTP